MNIQAHGSVIPATASGLNQGQQEGADAFFQFLLSDRKEFNIVGPGGVGKTFLLKHLIEKTIPEYRETCQLLGIESKFNNLALTATTHQAAGVVARASGYEANTLHSLLGLKVSNDYNTGEQKLTRTKNAKVHEDMLLFVDEGSMVDSPLYTHTHKGLSQSKIVYIGDHCQLPPTKERLSPIYRNGIETVHLTEPMRNASQPALMAVCNQLRQTVETGEFHPIQIVPGVIDHLTPDQMQAELELFARTPDMDARIIAYTNNQVQLYNDFIRESRGLPPEITVGETLVNNRAIHLPDRMLPTDREVQIVAIDPTNEIRDFSKHGFTIEMIPMTIRFGGFDYAVSVPVDRDHFTTCIKWLAKQKDWIEYYNLMDSIPDLRPRDASTIHKAQGASFDTVYIDLENISTCHQPLLVARLLYVAFTRARNRIVLYGQLAGKYGGLSTV